MAIAIVFILLLISITPTGEASEWKRIRQSKPREQKIARKPKVKCEKSYPCKPRWIKISDHL